MASTAVRRVAIGALLLLWSAAVQWPSRSVGLFYDDFLVFRHYSAEVVLRSWWTDLAVLTSPELWVPAYRPLTLLVHSLTYESFGFRPDGLLFARILMGALIGSALYAWIARLADSRSVALFTALLFLTFPVNFYAFTWNTEIGAISSLVWLLLALAFATGACRWPSRHQYAAACLCWTFALLTKEVVVPLVVLFPLIWLFYGRTTTLRRALVFSAPFLVLAALFVGIRFAVLHGAWGAQGISPDRGGSLSAYLSNYVLFLQWISYVLPVLLAYGNRFVGWPRVDVVMLVAPLALALLELSRSAAKLRHHLSLGRIRDLDPTEKQMCLGLATAVFGGLICCFLPVPRIMFAAALGPVLLIGVLPALVRRVAGRVLATTVCLIVLVVNGLWYFDSIHGRQSDFVRLRNLQYVESFFSLAHLFEQWGLQPQAAFLREKLVDEHLIDPVSGRLQGERFHAYLISIGVPEPQATLTVQRLQVMRGAYQ